MQRTKTMVLCCNMGSLEALYEAARLGRPFISENGIRKESRVSASQLDSLVVRGALVFRRFRNLRKHKRACLLETSKSLEDETLRTTLVFSEISKSPEDESTSHNKTTQLRCTHGA
jgi:hypothetical protein